jgi:hypothetical protein
MIVLENNVDLNLLLMIMPYNLFLGVIVNVYIMKKKFS